MKRIYYQIDKDGFIIWDSGIVLEENEEIPEGYYLQPLYGEGQPSFYKPKWDGEKWVEGATQEEIEAMNDQSKIPTIEDRLNAIELLLLEQILSLGEGE